MDKKLNRFKLFRIICLICYVICIAVLIIESCMDGDSSSKQSDAVGGSLANIVNDIGGDQTVVVNPKEVIINNKINSAKVNSTYELHVIVLPEDTTNKSVLYESSNSNVADVTPDGKITFLNPGEVTISASSAKDPSLKDFITINVSHIEVETIDVKIDNKDPNDINTIYLGESYQLSVNYYPENATNNNISFKTDNSNYLSVSSTGVITPLNYSNETIITVTIKVGTITKELKFITEIKNKIDLISITPENSSYSIYETESRRINFNFDPVDATFKEYILTSNDSKICSVQNSTIKGVKAGTATITVTSKMNKDIKSTFEVEVKPRENIKEFNVTSTYIRLNIGSSSKIGIKIITPNKYALTSSLTYSSNDTTIATVSSNGTVKGLKEGTAEITIKNSDSSCIKTVTIEVIKYTPPSGVDKDTTTTDMDIKLVNSKYFYTQTAYKLTDIIEVIKFYNKDNDENYLPADQRISYSSNDDVTIVNGHIFSKAGERTITVEHIASGITKTITIIFVDKPNVSVNDEIPTNEPINLLTNETCSITISYEKDFHLDLIDDNLGFLENITKNNYIFTPYNTEGLVTIILVPLYNGEEINDLAITLKINIYQIKTTKINFELINTETNDILIIKNDSINLKMNQEILINVILDEKVSISNVTFTSSNKDVLEITEIGEIILKRQGIAKITITEEVTSLSKSITIMVYNIIKINTDNPITITGKDISYNKEKETYQITNGYSGLIKLNFTDDSTYKIVKYKSSNQKVISVGEDGSLIPHKKGTSTITLKIDDGMTNEIEIQIKIKVMPQKVVNNLSAFLHKVRKGIGHFGAFFVFGIFSTFTFLLYFRYKKWIFSVPLCFIQGFGLAALTEYIQTFVPGRCGLFSDVIIDFSGFCSSAVILSITILLIYLVKYLKLKKKENEKI